MFEFCDEGLQSTLKQNRAWKLQQDEKKLGVKSLVSVVEEKGAASDSRPMGRYELIGLITHQGRSADSGHYIGWARSEKDLNKWHKFDDQNVTPVTEDEIKQLAGGGGIFTELFFSKSRLAYCVHLLLSSHYRMMKC